MSSTTSSGEALDSTQMKNDTRESTAFWLLVSIISTHRHQEASVSSSVWKLIWLLTWLELVWHFSFSVCSSAVLRNFKKTFKTNPIYYLNLNECLCWNTWHGGRNWLNWECLLFHTELNRFIHNPVGCPLQLLLLPPNPPLHLLLLLPSADYWNCPLGENVKQ